MFMRVMDRRVCQLLYMLGNHAISFAKQEPIDTSVPKKLAILPCTGDFWHARGALPVEPLNQVLRVLRGWTRPTLMLVGNHDQVTMVRDLS